MDFSNYDWKLGPNVQTKIILKRLEIQNETTTQNYAGQAGTNMSAAPKSSNRKRKLSRSTSFTSTQETETNPVDRDSAVNLNSGEIIQELQKVIVDFDPGCSTCSSVIRQLSRHIRDIHSTQAPPPRHRGKRNSSLVPVHESETCPSPSPTIVPPQGNISLQCHLGSHTPPTFVMRPSDSSDTMTSVRQAPSFEVTDGVLRRSTRERKTINYADLILGPEPATTTFLDNSDSTRDEDGHQDCSSGNTEHEIKVENEIDICEDEDPSYIFERHHDDGEGDLSGNIDDGISNDDFSEAELEREDSFAADKEIQNIEKDGRDESQTEENGIEVKKSIQRLKKFKHHKCETCLKLFGSKYMLGVHMRVHHSEENGEGTTQDISGGKWQYECETCEKSFSSESRLRIHSRIHTGINLYKCEIEECGKNYIGENMLKIHKRIHLKDNGEGTSGEKWKYKCKTCRKSFSSKSRLRIHNRIHTGLNLNKCEICGKSYTRKNVLKIHKRLHTRDKKTYKCSCCDKEFLSKRTLNVHIYLRKRMPKCNFCKLEFVNNEDLNEHMKSSHSEKFANPYKCNICKSMKFGTGKEIRSHFEQTHPHTLPHSCQVCKKSYRLESDLNKHLLWHRKLDRHKCEYCGRGFRLPHVLEAHLRVHTKEKPHKCEVCGKCFAAKEALTKHKDSHTGGKSHTCEKCDQSFDSKDILLTHIDETHGRDQQKICTGEKIEKRKNYGCGICSNNFFQYEHLSVHLRRCHANVLTKKYACRFCDQKFFTTLKINGHVEKLHPGQKSFQCKICNKEFAREGLLLVHSVNHTEERTISCTHPDCEKKFKTRATMNRHLIKHTRIKPHNCDECGKTFTAAWSLTLHKKCHTGEKPFMCEVCSKCFSTKSGLYLHAKIHKDDKSHVCKECGKCFTHRGQLTTHSKIHSGVKEHLCEECGASFRLPHQLRAHLKSQAHTIRK